MHWVIKNVETGEYWADHKGAPYRSLRPSEAKMLCFEDDNERVFRVATATDHSRYRAEREVERVASELQNLANRLDAASLKLFHARRK